MEKTNISTPVPQLPVEDVEKAQIYYRDFWGFDVLWLTPDKYIGAVTRGDTTIFFAKTNRPIEPNIHWLFVEDVNATYTEFKERGANITDDIEDKPWNTRQFTLQDINGHIFYVYHG